MQGFGPAARQFAEVMDEVTVEEEADGTDRSGVGLERGEIRPVDFQQFEEEGTGCDRETGLGGIGIEPLTREEFEFEGEDGAGGGRMGFEVLEEVDEECVELRDGCVGFGDQFHQTDGVGDDVEGVEVGGDARMPADDGDFAQGMEFGAAAAEVAEVGGDEEIEFAEKRGAGTSCALGDGGESAEVGGEPLDDETGLGEGADAEDDSMGSFIHGGAGAGADG